MKIEFDSFNEGMAYFALTLLMLCALAVFLGAK